MNKLFANPKLKVATKWGLIIFIGLVILTALVVGFSFVRHRQLCAYQALVDSGRLINQTDRNLCPNLLSVRQWPSILGNAFNLGILNSVVPGDIFAKFSNETGSCDDQLNPLCWLTGTRPDLKQTDGFTNLLLVGLDSKQPGDMSTNTDTIILASLENSTGKILLLSFPRDLYLDYYRPNGMFVSYKINAVYAIDGAEGLTGVIEQVTNKPIHYYAFLDINIFSAIIDSLGGVTIELDEDFKEWFPCSEVPEGRGCVDWWSRNNGYGEFSFSAGTHVFDSFDAQVYARSRQLTSDFDRAKRQQNLIKAVLSNIINAEGTITDRFSTYMNLYSIFVSQVDTNIAIEDLAALFSVLQKLDSNAAQVVVDWYLGGEEAIIYYLGILPDLGWSIGFRDKTYNQFRNYIDQIWQLLPYYVEQPRVLILEASGSNLPPETIDPLKDNPFIDLKIGTTNQELNGVRIYQLSPEEASGSVRDLQSRIPSSLVFNPRLDGVIQSEFAEDILIIWGK